MKKILFLILLSSTFTLCTKAQNYEGKIPADRTFYYMSRLFTKESFLCTIDDNQVTVYNDKFEIYRSFLYLSSPRFIKYFDIDQGITYSVNWSPFCTQTLFNDDDKFEYISMEADDDSGIIKYNVCSEDNSIISSIEPEEGYQFIGDDKLYKINGQTYFTVYEMNINNEDIYLAFYKIDKSSTNIKHVARMPITVSPTIADKSETITVELGDNHQVREITIVNAAGQVIKNIPVSPEQRIVNFSAQDLNYGLNIVNAPSGGNNNSFKIIIK